MVFACTYTAHKSNLSEVHRIVIMIKIMIHTLHIMTQTSYDVFSCVFYMCNLIIIPKQDRKTCEILLSRRNLLFFPKNMEP